MLKLRFGKPKMVYVENISEPVIVAEMKCTVYDNRKHIEVISFLSKGRVQCHAGDTYDKRYGTVLAISKAKIAAYKKAMHLYLPAGDKDYFEETLGRLECMDFYYKMKAFGTLERKDFENIRSLGKVPDRQKK